AQSFQVNGKITDDQGEPLIGVNVLNENSGNGTTTDLDGVFNMQATKGDLIVISYVGYSTQRITAESDAETWILTLQQSADVLDEIVVVGYGSESREVLTTSVSKIDNRVLENVPYANAASAIQGALSGVRVQTTTGQPGVAPRIIVRGGTSINNPNGASPLYVIDGVIRSNMDNINPEDIESLQVLKDAASTSIYGARGSNGVVVITTKSGKP